MEVHRAAAHVHVVEIMFLVRRERQRAAVIHQVDDVAGDVPADGERARAAVRQRGGGRHVRAVRIVEVHVQLQFL